MKSLNPENKTAKGNLLKDKGASLDAASKKRKKKNDEGITKFVRVWVDFLLLICHMPVGLADGGLVVSVACVIVLLLKSIS